MEKGSLSRVFEVAADEAKCSESRDYLIRHRGAYYAGRHLLIDIWGGKNLSNAGAIDTVLRRGAEEAGATLLHIHLHEFSKNGGISGVAVLAESHISIHTWPEWDYAAVDVFMCGETDPMRVADLLRREFSPSRLEISDNLRGHIR